MSWRELTYPDRRDPDSDCADTKTTLQWTPEADRAAFFRRGVRDAVRHADERAARVHVFPAFSTGGPEVATCS
jgi:hypothetical protein